MNKEYEMRKGSGLSNEKGFSAKQTVSGLKQTKESELNKQCSQMNKCSQPNKEMNKRCQLHKESAVSIEPLEGSGVLIV